MNSKQRKQFKKGWINIANKLAEHLEVMANDETKGEVLTKTDLLELATYIRELSK